MDRNRTLAFAYVGTGIGSGLIIDRSLYTGESGNASDLGHIDTPEARRALETMVDFTESGLAPESILTYRPNDASAVLRGPLRCEHPGTPMYADRRRGHALEALPRLVTRQRFPSLVFPSADHAEFLETPC